MPNIDVEKLLERILIEFKDYNPFVYKYICETTEVYMTDSFEWYINLNNKLCICLSGEIDIDKNGKSILHYFCDNKIYNQPCNLDCKYINIYKINKNIINEDDVYNIDDPIYELEQITTEYGYNEFHKKYLNFDIIISELKEFINKST